MSDSYIDAINIGGHNIDIYDRNVTEEYEILKKEFEEVKEIPNKIYENGMVLTKTEELWHDPIMDYYPEYAEGGQTYYDNIQYMINEGIFSLNEAIETTIKIKQDITKYDQINIVYLYHNYDNSKNDLIGEIRCFPRNFKTLSDNTNFPINMYYILDGIEHNEKLQDPEYSIIIQGLYNGRPIHRCVLFCYDGDENKYDNHSIYFTSAYIASSKYPDVINLGNIPATYTLNNRFIIPLFIYGRYSLL